LVYIYRQWTKEEEEEEEEKYKFIHRYIQRSVKITIRFSVGYHCHQIDKCLSKLVTTVIK